MTGSIEQAARDLLALQAELEELQRRIAEQKAVLTDAVEVGGTVDLDGTPVFRVQQNHTFKLDLAEQVLPAEVIAACTTTVEQIDPKKVRAYAEAMGVIAQCEKVSEPFVAIVRSR